MLVEFFKSIFYYRRIDFRGKLLIFLWLSLFADCNRIFSLFFHTQSIFINTHYLRKQHYLLVSILISRSQYLLLTHHTTAHHITSHLSTSHHITSHLRTSHHSTSHHTSAHHSTPHYIAPHYTTPHHTTLIWHLITQSYHGMSRVWVWVRPFHLSSCEHWQTDMERPETVPNKNGRTHISWS